MPRKRALKDAVKDPLAEKRTPPPPAALKESATARREVGFWPTLATLTIGLLGGILIGRFIKWR